MSLVPRLSYGTHTAEEGLGAQTTNMMYLIFHPVLDWLALMWRMFICCLATGYRGAEETWERGHSGVVWRGDPSPGLPILVWCRSCCSLWPRYKHSHCCCQACRTDWETLGETWNWEGCRECIKWSVLRFIILLFFFLCVIILWMYDMAVHSAIG